MISYRPAQYTPRLSQAIVAPIAPAVVSPPVVSTGGGSPVPEGLFWTALAAAASYAAIQTGLRTKGFNSVVGWAGGIAAGLGAIVGLAGVVAPSAARGLPVRWYWTA